MKKLFKKLITFHFYIKYFLKNSLLIYVLSKTLYKIVRGCVCTKPQNIRFKAVKVVVDRCNLCLVTSDTGYVVM